jgi:hypothetical protein
MPHNNKVSWLNPPLLTPHRLSTPLAKICNVNGLDAANDAHLQRLST